MNSQLNIDVNNLCRTCLTSTFNLRSLSAQISDNRTIFEALSNILNKEIMISELLPYKICEECESCLYQYDNFKQKCLESEEIIKSWYVTSSIDKSEDSSCSEDVASNVTIPYQCAICLNKFMNIIDLQDHYANIHVDKNNKVEIFYTQERNPVWFSTVKEESSEEDSSSDESSDGVPDGANEFPIDSYSYNNVVEEPNNFIIPEIVCDNAASVEVDIVKLEEKEIEKKEIELHIVEEPVIEPVKEEVEAPIVEYQCDVCDISFKTSRAIKIHTKRIHGYTLGVEYNSTLGRKCEVQYLEVEQLECSKCMRKFHNKQRLENHLKKHEENSKKCYTCNFCKRDFQRKAHLENHITSLHMKNKINKGSSKNKHKCEQCGKSFQMLCTLQDHLRVHTGEKPFLCSVCGRSFSQKTNLKEHTRRHLGVKPYKCEICSQSFVSKGELTSHQRTHSGAHPFVCDICNNSFTTSSSLAKHKRIHVGDKRFSCDLCPMKFIASSTLRNHRRTHTGEKPYNCTHCDKAFIQKNDLLSHLRCHTGERPYVCVVCNQAFRQNSTLRTHAKIHKETPVVELPPHQGNINNIGNVMGHQNVCIRQLPLS